jgi:hypothetical protein
MNPRKIGYGLAALAAVILAVTFSGGDERALRRNLRRIATDLEKDGPENLWSAERRADRIARRFAPEPDIRTDLPWADLDSRSELRATVFRARALAERIRVRLEDVEVRVDPGRKSATLTGTVWATVTGPGESGSLVQEFEVEWIREEEGWLIATVRTRDAIRRPE